MALQRSKKFQCHFSLKSRQVKRKEQIIAKYHRGFLMCSNCTGESASDGITGFGLWMIADIYKRLFLESGNAAARS